METVVDLLKNPIIFFPLVFIIAFVGSLYIHPAIIKIANAKKLMDEPDHRSAHIKSVPNLGGIGIFLMFVLTLSILGLSYEFLDLNLHRLLALFASVTILFFLGVQDDLVGITPKKKLLAQIIVSLIIIFYADVRIESLHGLFGMETLPDTVSIFISAIFYVVFINSFNLIDGIDGLAAVTAIIASLLFGVFFIVEDSLLMAFISLALVGCLVGFLKYNFSKTNKIFMGDSGSMFVGFILMVQAMYFLEMDFSNPVLFQNRPVLIFAVFSFPVLDTLRVFIIRVLNGKSPFNADRNHLHHKLLDFGLSHVQATLILGLCTIVMIFTAFLTQKFEVNIQFLILLPIAILVFYLPCIFKLKKQNTIPSQSVVLKKN